MRHLPDSGFDMTLGIGLAGVVVTFSGRGVCRCAFLIPLVRVWCLMLHHLVRLQPVAVVLIENL